MCELPVTGPTFLLRNFAQILSFALCSGGKEIQNQRVEGSFFRGHAQQLLENRRPLFRGFRPESAVNKRQFTSPLRMDGENPRSRLLEKIEHPHIDKQIARKTKFSTNEIVGPK